MAKPQEKEDLPAHGEGIRGVFIWDKEKQRMVPKKDFKKKIIAAPFVQQDTIEPIMSHATREGKVFESKSALRRHYKEHGFRETGGEDMKDIHKRPLEESQEYVDRTYKRTIEECYHDVKNDRIEFTEEEKENHLREERRCPKKLKPMY